MKPGNELVGGRSGCSGGSLEGLTSILRLTVLCLLAVVLIFLALIGRADATIITWNFGLSPGNHGTLGNERTFVADGITVTVTAWGLTGSGGTLQTAALGQWPTGLGSCNQQEGTGCGNPAHQVDNVYADDFVLFRFSSPVDPTSIVIDPYGWYDRDVSYWVGNAANPLDLTGLGLSGLLGLGFGSQTNVNNSPGSSPLSIPLTSGLVNSLLFGASATWGDDDDRFKIKSLTAQVPEPGILLLLGSGLVGAGVVGQRIRKRG